MDRTSRLQTVAKGWLFFAVIFVSLTVSGICGTTEDYMSRIEQAQALLRSQDSKAALTAFKRLLIENPSFQAYFGVAQASAIEKQPEEALLNFREALMLADDQTEKRTALFGIARMLMWLEQYGDAENIYSILLSRPLNDEDHAVASAGLMRSLSFQNKPMKAYRSVSRGLVQSPAQKIELARAASWAGWPDKAAELLDQGIPVEPDTRMAKELEDIRKEVDAGTANPLSLHAEYTSDSDNLRIRKTELSAGKRLSRAGTLSFAAQHQGMESPTRQLAMNSILARYSSRLEDKFWFSVQMGPAFYDEWHPVLWSASGVYRPDDEFRYEAFILREAVETFAAIDLRTRLDTAGFAIEYRPNTRFSLAGSAYRQSFSDENNRIGGNASVGALVAESLGLSVQLKARYFGDSRTDTIGYFNPERFHQEQLLFSLNRHLGTDWRFFTVAGPGTQRVTPGERTNTSLAQISLWGTIIRDLSLGLDYGYSNSALASSSGYRRQYSGATLSYAW